MNFARRRPIFQPALDSAPGRDTAVAPGPHEYNPSDEWPDDVRFWPTAPDDRFWPTIPATVEAPAGPTRRTFLGFLLGAGATLAVGTGRAIGSTVVPGPGPLERAYRRWVAAIRETQAANDDPDGSMPYETEACQEQERRLGAALDAAQDARHDLILAIAAATGYAFTAPGRFAADVCGPVATIREGRHLYLLTPDHESDGGRVRPGPVVPRPRAPPPGRADPGHHRRPAEGMGRRDRWGRPV